MVDNHDSFTWNLVHGLVGLGAAVDVRAKDERFDPECTARYDAVVISPGPGPPADAGGSVDVLRDAWGRVPVLGVCLGHQVIAAAAGGRTIRAPRPVHGKTSRVFHRGRGLFRGLPSPIEATRYHSLTVDEATLGGELRVDARSEDGCVMALSHRRLPVWGVQFHPESVLTVAGPRLLDNFLERVRKGMRTPRLGRAALEVGG